MKLVINLLMKGNIGDNSILKFADTAYPYHFKDSSRFVNDSLQIIRGLNN
jgi:hypothetical protein